CFFALQLSKAELDTEMKNQLPADLETRISLKKIEELFGATDMAMLVVSADDVTQPANLTQLKSLSEAASALSRCERVVSPHTAKDIASEGGETIVRPAIAPEGEARTPASTRAALEKNPLVMGNLVSSDFRNAVIICFVSPKVKDTTL